MTSTFPCPSCATPLPAGTPACPHCGTRLTGVEAARLWEVNQQIAVLQEEAARLLQALRQPQPAGLPVPASAPGPTGAGPRARSLRGPSAQQLLLGVGAVLLLSAASFFLWVVWVVVGLAGQALIMATLTGLAVAGSAAAAARGLRAAAETGAVIASGLLLIDLSAAHALGLGGLDRVATDSYWVGACLLAAVLLVGADRLVAGGAGGRAVLTFRPVAASMVALVPWLLVSVAEPTGAGAVGALLLVAVTSSGAAVVAAAVDHSRSLLRGRALPASAAVLALSAGVGAIGYLVLGLAAAYETGSSATQRYTAWALLALLPVATAVLSSRVGARLGRGLERQWPTLPYVAVLLALPLAPVPLLDLDVAVLVALAVAVAALVVAHHLGLSWAGTPVRRAWSTALAGAAWLAQPALVLLVQARAEGLPTVVVATPAVVWAVAALVGVWRRRTAAWVVVAQVAVAVSLHLLVAPAAALVATWTAVAAFTGQALLGALAARTATAAARSSAWRAADLSAVLLGVLYAVAAVGGSFGTSVLTAAAVLVVIGVVTIAYAGAPGRLPFAYLGSLTVSAGTALLLAEASVDVVEAFTAPLVLLLAGIGWVQWRRDRGAPTVLTMGPALSAALGPTLLVAVGSGDELRLAAVSAAATLAMVVGLTRRWKAPVATSAMVLVVVAVTQGGPLVAYVPTWVTLGAAGAALLAAGVAWERAVLAGRRANAWFATLG